MLIANAASIINGPLDGKKRSHPSSIHRVETLSRTGRLSSSRSWNLGNPSLSEGSSLPGAAGCELCEGCKDTRASTSGC